MNNPVEIAITRHNPHIDPLHVWGWEIPVYLFLGGLVAGLMILAGISYLLKKDEEMPFVHYVAPLWIVPLLGLGMFALFLDLSHKLYVWRFYTSFQLTSPMSWGAWVLLLVFPIGLIFSLLQLRDKDREWLEEKAGKIPGFVSLLALGIKLVAGFEKWKKQLAVACVVLGVFLGIYTGILLSAFAARPFWNTSILGFLFLASGLSAASAFGILFAENKIELKTLVKLDIAFLILEIVIFILIFIGWFGSGEASRIAGSLVFGGPYTAAFWGVVIIGGLLVPLFLEFMELKGKVHLRYSVAALVLVGGFMLRVFMVYIGQHSHVIL